MRHPTSKEVHVTLKIANEMAVKNIFDTQRDDGVGYFTKDTVYQTLCKLSDLTNKVANLRDNLSELLIKIEHYGYDINLNSLGEIQNSAPQIDLLCAEISMLKNIQQKLNAANKSEKRND